MATRQVLDIAFIGAGAIHFGQKDLPWDHASRIERLGAVRIVGIVDVDVAKAENVLQIRRQSSSQYGHLYKDCQAFKSLDDLLAVKKVDAVFLGLPPFCHGSMEEGKDLDLQCVSRGLHLFAEKPLSCVPPEQFSTFGSALLKAQNQTKTIVSVGYMFRYHAAVQKMKQLIASHGGPIMAVNARYHLAYPSCKAVFWWDLQRSGGPIVEQATHLCDLIRYLAGEVIEKSIQSVCVPASDTPGEVGHLSKIPEACDVGLNPEQRAPRVTMALWRFQGGGVGTLTHTISLPGARYEANLEVLLDGLRIYLYEPYSTDCQLRVRGIDSDPDKEVVFNFGDADPYEEEIKCFLDAVRQGDGSSIQSTYADAIKTYNFSWAIRRAGEVNK